MKDNSYLINKNPLTSLFVFFLPLALANVLQQFYNLVDSAILGQFVSEAALAASAACLSFINIFVFIGSGFGIGSGVVIGQYFGAKNYERVKVVINTTLIFSFILSIFLGVFGVFSSKIVMILLDTPSDSLDLACDYLNIYFLGMGFVIIYNVVSAMYNALGKSKYPLLFLIISSVINILLDLLFVIKYSLGIKGVAFATIIAQGVSCVLSFVIFFINLRRYNIPKTKFIKQELFDKNELIKVLKIGLPSIFQQATISIGLMLIQSTVNSFGSNALAGYSVGMRIEGLGSAFVISCGAALSTYVAQNLGAKKYERISKGYVSANAIIIFFSVIFYICVFFFKEQIIYSFIGRSCSTVAFDTAKEVLIYMSTVMFILGFKHTADGILRGLGSMKMFTIANIVNIVIRVMFSKIMAPIIGIKAVWISNPIGWTCSLLICYFTYRKIKKNFM